MPKKRFQSLTPTKTKLQLPYFVLPLTTAGHFFIGTPANELPAASVPLFAHSPPQSSTKASAGYPLQSGVLSHQHYILQPLYTNFFASLCDPLRSLRLNFTAKKRTKKKRKVPQSNAMIIYGINFIFAYI